MKGIPRLTVASILLGLLMGGGIFFLPGSGSQTQAGVAPPLDHFWCYQSQRPIVQLQDQFDLEAGGTETATLAQPQIFLCNPTSKVHAGQTTPIQNADHHLKLYPMRAQPLAPVREVVVSNQFGDNQVLTLGQPQILAIPTQKLPHQSPTGLDHFKCYQVTSGASVQTLVALTDQFQSQGRVSVSSPAYFCNPVKKVHNGVETPILNPEDHLVCYEGTRIGVNVRVDLTNQFGNETLHLTSTRFLCVPSQKLTLQPSGEILFTSYRDGNAEIYRMNRDGTGQVNLTNHPASDTDPAWSPDGTKFAFVSDRDGDNEIYIKGLDGTAPIKGLDGSEVIQLTFNLADDFAPTWSPDGTKIAYTTNLTNNLEIFTMNALDGSDQINITNNPAPDLEPSWSPDGTTLAIRSGRGSNDDIWVVPIDGSTPDRLTTNPSVDWAPDWSPDGTEILFTSFRDNDHEIYKMNSNGANQIRLTNIPGEDMLPAWSPGGTEFTFVSARDLDFEIYTANADGSNPNRLTDSLGADLYPDWGPPPP